VTAVVACFSVAVVASKAGAAADFLAVEEGTSEEVAASTGAKSF
jgi:hypothetical protein